MLNQINQWMEYVSAGFDVILLARVLLLRLQRTYVFLTLTCVLGVLFDAVVLSLAHGTPERLRVEVYANLLFAFVFPLAAWDVFEEVGNSLSNIRRLAILRTFTSLLMITFFAFVLASPAFKSDDPMNLTFVLTLTLVVSTGSATGSLAFLWAMHRAMKVQNISSPKNTSVWLIFYALFLAAQVLTWFFSLLEDFLGQPSTALFPQLSDFILTLYGIGITLWCAAKLKSLPKDMTSASLNEPS